MKYFIILMLGLAITGCLSASTDDSLLGEDKDGNGVRDDVDRFIEKEFVGIDNVKAAKQYAKYHTKSIIYHKLKQKVIQLQDMTSKSSQCYSSLNPKKRRAFFDLDKIIVEIENTKERLLASKKADEALAATMHVYKRFGIKGCEFKITEK